MGRKSLLDKEKIIQLYKDGLTLRAIAKEINSNEDTIRMFIKKNAASEVKKRKENISKRKKTNFISGDDELELDHSHFLNPDDLKEIREEKGWGILPHESIGDYGFFSVNKQSYKLSKNRKKLIFDETRGVITQDVPRSF
ncbi:helix-turn-helix domain-containing protein [Clostridium estertheticum]|uniref:helix-turn-helix domain-containing protein n=1 Tax=Clostridium estertheticum TaxID=238834 RepID=UPI001C0D191D|nr:helix-turn-helix domain-containing protein [Clostridium estertheticum]MBU3174420.1 RNA polymerase subunit sigma-24 [Clostridium estertheticum]